MKPEHHDLVVNQLQGYRIYFKECWKQFLADGGKPMTHNTFYDYMKDKISADLTKLTGADKPQVKQDE